MLEIVHDLAPGAQLAFSGPSTSLEMIESVNFLANTAFDGSGADIVVDDLGFFGEPFFEDGPIAQAVASAVANGTIYVSSAGNAGENHFEGQYVAGTADFHDFGGGYIAMRVTVPGGGVVTVVLQWNDQFGASNNDYDLWLCPAGLTPIVDFLSCFSSTALQDGDDDPFEFVIVINSGSTAGGLYIFVDGFFAANSRRLELFIPQDNVTVNQFVVPDGSVFGHPAVPGVIAAAAISAADDGHDTIESFSSRGPAEVFFPSFESRLKPDVAAIDGVSVTGAGGFPSTFFGTSTAAPHVAGVAALVLEALRQNQSGLSKVAAATAVFNSLQGTAVDLGDGGLDPTFGAGRIDGLAGVQSTAITPGPPTNVTAGAGDGQATVTWDAPAADGGSAISQYTVTSDPDGLVAAVGGSTLSATVTGLTNGGEYTFTVTATNTVGVGDPSVPSNSVAPKGPPDAPTSVTAVAGNATATVAWTAPSDDGGSPITQYTVTSNPGGLTAVVDGSTLSATVTGLNNGTAVAGNATATVAWSAPADDGGSPITQYTVTSNPGGITAVVDGSTLSATVTGLANGTSYTFSVAASNAAGTGASSSPSNAVTPVGLPGAPTNVAAVAGDGQATVTWSAPAAEGGSAITQYTATSSPDGVSAVVDGSTLSATVTRLTNGTSYTFSVAATNAVGTGAASAPSNAVTPMAVPIPTFSVSSVTVDEGSGNATVTIALDNATTSGVTVQYATADGTATSPDDYEATSTTATIPANQTSTSVQVSIVDDSLDEPDETFTVALSSSSAGTQISGINGTSTVTITDDDPEPAPVPSLSTWGLIVMAGLLALFGAFRVSRFAPLDGGRRR